MSVSQHYAVDLCFSAYVPGSISYSHAPCPTSTKNILSSMKKTLGMQGRALSQAGSVKAKLLSHTAFLHPQRNDRSGKPMLIKAGSLASLILTCVPTCRYVMPSIS